MATRSRWARLNEISLRYGISGRGFDPAEIVRRLKQCKVTEEDKLLLESILAEGE